MPAFYNGHWRYDMNYIRHVKEEALIIDDNSGEILRDKVYEIK